MNLISSVLAIDPGRSKCGLAVVALDGEILHRSIVATVDLSAAISPLLTRFKPDAIVAGNGTGESLVRDVLAGLPAPVEFVDERHTSEVARARYVAETPARGFARLLPRSLRSPDAPYDDLVAVILAERWLAALPG